MKAFLISFTSVVFLLLTSVGQAQDVIYMRSGERIKAKVIEITGKYIIYCDSYDYLLYVIDTSRTLHPEELYSLQKLEVAKIVYSDGSEEIIGYRTNHLRTNSPLPKRTIQINPLGLLQFGPVVQGEFKVSEQGYFTSHVRIPYLGILYHVLNADAYAEDGSVSPVALGLGAGYKSLFVTPRGAWYMGGVAEYSFGSSMGSDERLGDWQSRFSNVALMANGGFRWRHPKKKSVLSLGAYMGAFAALRDEWWYVSSPQRTNDERTTSLLFMLELSFGWEHR